MPVYQPGIAGKTFTQEASESIRAYANIFSSSVPQRPKPSSRRHSGRPLGPHTYHPPNPAWVIDARRLHSTFASKTAKDVARDDLLTAEVDYTNRPELWPIVHGAAPGTRSLPWSKIPDARPATMPIVVALDRFYGEDFGPKDSLVGAVTASARKYASSFTGDRRFRPPKEATPQALGPGAYTDTTLNAIQVHDEKRSSSAFKVQLASTFIPLGQSDPPDMIHSPLLAKEAKTWTSKGCAFSTRERFPRIRPRWQD